MDIVIPGTKYAGNRISSTINGIPAQGMQLLYTFEDGGSDDATWNSSSVVDVSGNSRNATFAAGSSKIKRTLGIGTSSTPGNGLAIITPLAIDGPFTALMVVRNLLGNGPGAGFTAYYKSSAAVGTLSSAGSLSPGFGIVENLQDGAGEASPRILRLQSPSQTGGPSSAFIEEMTPSATKTSIAAVAVSVDPDSNTVIVRCRNGSIVTTAAGVADSIYQGSSPKHAFGITKAGSNPVEGQLGMAAVFDYAADLTRLDQLLAAARASVGARTGYTIV